MRPRAPRLAGAVLAPALVDRWSTPRGDGMANTSKRSGQAWGSCLVCGAREHAVPRMLTARIGSRHTMWLCGDCAEVAANRQFFIDRYAAIWGLFTVGER